MNERARWIIDPEASEVSIDGASSLHPIRAAATGLDGWVETSIPDNGLAPGTEVRGYVSIDVHRLESGNPLIDRETRRRIRAQRYPRITGEVVAGVVTTHGALALEGVIDFRGERVEVEGTMTATPVDSSRMVLAGSSRFDVRWWGLRPPRLGLLRVYPEIDVSVHLEVQRDG